MIVLLLAVLGLCFGSFVNALVWRTHERAKLLEKRDDQASPSKSKQAAREEKELHDLSIWRGRSMCPHCRHVLAPKDLVPVLSWLSLRGRCRYCHKKIEDTPFAELLMPLVFVASYLWWPATLHGVAVFQFVTWLIFIIGFVALTVYDLKWLLLPNIFVYPLMALAASRVVVLATDFHLGWTEVIGAVTGVLIVGGLFYVLYVASGGSWIGGGDVKLGVVLGLLAGGPMHSVLLLFTASLAGVVFAVPQLVSGHAMRKTQIPFGPFLILAALVVQLFGSSLVDWYERLLA